MAKDSLYIALLFITLILPLVSAIVSFVVRESYAWLSGMLATGFMLIAGVLTTITIFQFWNQNSTLHLAWFTLGTTELSADIHLSQNALVMMMIVMAVSILVHLYSIGYMVGDRNIRRYFGMLGIFTFTMNGIVLADNLLLIFLFWELVGFSSYMLIGHWTKKLLAGKAAFKAFLMNRIGDVAFLVGLMVLWTDSGTLSLSTLAVLPDSATHQTAALLLIFGGVIAKSAQFPLFPWLPDAMEGPTPVSALIHAATMVAAGVYLLIRVTALPFSSIGFEVISYVGLITALIGALSALAQFDLKRILAYSTVSQLGLMITAIGAGANDAAFFHLFSHAFFKACLFLSAGSVAHALKNNFSQQGKPAFDVLDIREHGGLRTNMPVTFICFLISGGALAGLPLTTGFMSKEAMLLQTYASGNYLIFAALLIISFITVLYTFRMIASIFFGSSRNDLSFVTEVPPVMRFATVILAAASLWLVVSLNPFTSLPPWATEVEHSSNGIVILFSILIVFAGLAIGYLLYKRPSSQSIILFQNGFYIDSLYQKSIVPVTLAFSRASYRLDRKVFDVILHASAYGHVTAAHVIGWIDKVIVDGIVHLLGSTVRLIGSFFRSFQGGKVQGYVFWAILAMIIFIIWTL